MSAISDIPTVIMYLLLFTAVFFFAVSGINKSEAGGRRAGEERKPPSKTIATVEGFTLSPNQIRNYLLLTELIETYQRLQKSLAWLHARRSNLYWENPSSLRGRIANRWQIRRVEKMLKKTGELFEEVIKLYDWRMKLSGHIFTLPMFMPEDSPLPLPAKLRRILPKVGSHR
ncbi:MAG: hypothetical protein UX94_C0011G0031 [Parcubacteria group bacterium GW2011_GWA2_47_21]|nr:MAG: hypothetical protein UX94_C0011G0031 [Parcubacteria group bacterium GW2011_GWA2_47_21]